MPSKKLKIEDEMDPLLPMQQIRKILGVTAETIRKRIRKGDLSAVKIGARYYVHKSELERYVRSLHS